MVKGGTLGVAHPYCPICNIDDIALCASRTEFDTEAGYGNRIGRYGHEYLRRTNRPSFSFEPACAWRTGGAVRGGCR